MNAKKQSYSGAELREQAERFAAQLDPTAEAERHERSFLGAMGTAKEHFDWLVEHQAWTMLGHATFADWWDERVVPVAAGLGMRPTREIAKTVVEIVAGEQKALPRDQRKSQKQIAAMVGLGVGTVNRQLNPAAEPPNGTPHSVPNGTPEAQADPLSLVPEAERAVENFINNQTSGLADTSPADESGDSTPAGLPPASDAPEEADRAGEDQPEEGRPGAAAPGGTADDAPPPSGSAGGADDVEGASSGQTTVGESPRSPAVVAEREQDSTGVAAPAPVSAQRVETDEERAAREDLEFRTDRTLEFSTALVNLTMRLGSDPIAWFENVYLPGVFANRDLPRVRDCFEPKSLHNLAAMLDALGEYMTQTGKTL